MHLARGLVCGAIAGACIAACGGKIAPIDTFDDDPIAGATGGTSGTAGRPLPTPAPTAVGPMPRPVEPRPLPHPDPDPTHDDPPMADSFVWEPLDFATDPNPYSGCLGGKKLVRASERFGLWVGVELCRPDRYKIYLGFARNGVYREVADHAGSGQDHCELVNPTFTLPDEDDIQSACRTCDLEYSGYDGRGSKAYVFARGFYGEDFTYEPWSAGAYSAAWYECGVALP